MDARSGVEWFMGQELLRVATVYGGSFTIIDLMEINDQCIPTLRNCKEIKQCGHVHEGHVSQSAWLRKLTEMKYN